MSAIIYAVRNDRLGGRLGALLNAARISRDYGMEFRGTWACHDQVSPELRNPEQLFSAQFLNDKIETTRSFGDLQREILSVEDLPLTMTEAEFRNLIEQGRAFRCNEAMRPIVLPWEEDAAIAERIAAALDLIEFHPTIAQSMAAIRQKFQGARVTAYHLRRGDIIDPNSRPSNTLWPDKYLPRVYYEIHISNVLAQSPSNRILIFSDSPREVAFLKALNPRVLAAGDILDNMTLTLLQRDFMELFTMSQCGEVIGPGASAFSSVAALLGNGRIKDIRSDLTPEQSDWAMNELTRRIDEAPEMFAGDADLGQNFPALIQFHQNRSTPDIAVRLLHKHFDRGFSQSYIYDLLAEQYFLSGNAEGARQVAEALKNRPIFTDHANALTYGWAGLAALAAGNVADATRYAQVCRWLHPVLPIVRILTSALQDFGQAEHDQDYPMPQVLMRSNPVGVPKFLPLAERLKHLPVPIPVSEGKLWLRVLPFELDIRDWHIIQTAQLPSTFWNIPRQQKLLRFFQLTYAQTLNHPSVLSLMGQLHCQAGQTKEGRHLIEQALVSDSSNAFACIRYARMLDQLGRTDDALEYYDLASRLANEQICFDAERGRAHLLAGNKDTAFRIFERLAKVDHSMIEILIVSADVLRRKQSTRETALGLARKADSLAPGAVRTTQILRKILNQMDMSAEADEIARRLTSWKRRPRWFSSRIGTPGRN